MKRIIVSLLLLLCIGSVEASRIEPTNDIGLFINKDLFINTFSSLLESEVGIKILNITESEEYIIIETSNNIKTVLYLNSLKKIHSIGVYALPGYKSLDDEWLTFVLAFYSSGLFDSYEEAGKLLDGYTASYGTFITKNFGIEGGHEEQTGGYMIMIAGTTRDLSVHPGCDPNYVGVCIQKTNKNLNCSNVGIKNFFVVGTDKYHFDEDNNGVCCEPYPKFPK